jgi:hypothetical protein
VKIVLRTLCGCTREIEHDREPGLPEARILGRETFGTRTRTFREEAAPGLRIYDEEV